MELGDIVILKNIVFYNRDNTHEVDHAFINGRPCVYIGEYEDSMYFLPITRVIPGKENKFFNIVIDKNTHNKIKKDCKISFSTIIKKPIAFYKVVDYLEDSVIEELVDKALILYECDSFVNSDIAYNLFKEYAQKYKLETINYKTRKRKIDGKGYE